MENGWGLRFTQEETEMEKTIRWGILGPGGIAHKFADSLAVMDDATLHAVGSRSLDRAQAFAQQYGAAKAYGSYEELANDPDVDAIYIATPHPAHCENALLCINAGKPVLCEKPFTVNRSEMAQIAKLSREKKVFAMEAMWTRFLPGTRKVLELVNDGVIGEVRMCRADFGFRAEWKPEWRLLNPQLGGGALLDVGIYAFSYLSMIMGGAPTEVTSQAHIGTTGVDEQFTAVLGYGDGRIASASCAVRTQLDNCAWIFGTKGYIRVTEFSRPLKLELCLEGKEPEIIQFPYKDPGFQYEAAEVGRCLREGKLESDVMPLDESIAIMRTIDTVRGQWGIRYPFEK